MVASRSRSVQDYRYQILAVSRVQIADKLREYPRVDLIGHYSPSRESVPQKLYTWCSVTRSSRLFVEVNLRCLPRPLVRLEVGLLFKAHQPRHEHGGEATAGRVVVLRGHGVVVARSCQPVFRSGQLIL